MVPEGLVICFGWSNLLRKLSVVSITEQAIGCARTRRGMSKENFRDFIISVRGIVRDVACPKSSQWRLL